MSKNQPKTEILLSQISGVIPPVKQDTLAVNVPKEIATFLNKLTTDLIYALFLRQPKRHRTVLATGSSVPEVLTKSPIRSHEGIQLSSVTGSCWFANVSIKLFCLHMLIDTGAAVSLISKEVLDNIIPVIVAELGDLSRILGLDFLSENEVIFDLRKGVLNFPEF